VLEEGRRAQIDGFHRRAERLYRRVLNDVPGHPGALRQLGMLLLDAQRFDEAVRLFEREIESRGTNAAAWDLLGRIAERRRIPETAARHFRRAVLLSPGEVSGYTGVFRSHRGAVRASAMRRRLLLRPADVQTLTEAGICFEETGPPHSATEAYKRLQIVDPAALVGVFSLANLAKRLRHTETARRAYAHANALAPTHPNVINNLGTFAFGQSQWLIADTHFRRAVELAPAHVPALLNLARTSRILNEDVESGHMYRRALVAEPGEATGCCEYADLSGEDEWATRAWHLDPFAPIPYLHMARIAAGTSAGTGAGAGTSAVRNLRRSACLDPGHVETWKRLSDEHLERGEPDTAVVYGRRAVLLRSQDAAAQHTLALALLTQENFAEGWERYRRRVLCGESASYRRLFAIPEWTGQPLDGRRILLWREQGIGDEVMFLTLAHELSRRGAELVFVTEPRMRAILQRSFPGAMAPDVGPPTGRVEAHHGCDYHIAVGDLPHRLRLFCGGAVPPLPWIVPDPGKIDNLRKDLLRRQPGRRLVGITWRSQAPATGERRSIPAAMWRDVFRAEGVAFVSLQYGLTPEEAKRFAGAAGGSIDHAHGIEPLTDLDGLAALVSAVDLVISPANNTVHFAGASGKECWALVPTSADWRWGRCRGDSLWYRNMRVFRQSDRGDWSSIMNTLSAALNGWVAGSRTD
jgi:Tfp pilus assembly protein PilF